ncbi:MAG: hypothetical protein PF508_10040 [Spirochaeta sp.]|jgi:hypothetical protein|nr:hypothetical protein [Spirochaeta sp.]
MNLRAAVAGILLSSLALIVLPTPVPAQIVSQVVFLPQTYYIGDRVEARVVLRDVSVEEITIPDQLPTTPAVTIDSVSTVQRADGVEVRFVFQPFFTGTRELPPIDLDGVTVSGVSAFVTSVAGPGEELELVSVRDQLILPGTQLQLAFAMAALIGVPTVVIVAGGWGRRRLSGIRRWYRENRPYRTFLRSQKLLATEMPGLDGKSFYIRLLDTFRDYLDGRLGTRVRSATTGEMDHVLTRAHVDEELRTRIVELFRFGDLVKFARQRVTLEQRTVHVTEVRAVVDALQRHKPDGESAS